MRRSFPRQAFAATPCTPIPGAESAASTLPSIRDRAESAIVVYLAGPEAQQRHSPRSWRHHQGDSDFEQAFEVALGLSTSTEAAHAYLDWLAVVTRDEIAHLWPQVEKVAQALVRERTLTAAEIKTLLASV